MSKQHLDILNDHHDISPFNDRELDILAAPPNPDQDADDFWGLEDNPLEEQLLAQANETINQGNIDYFKAFENYNNALNNINPEITPDFNQDILEWDDQNGDQFLKAYLGEDLPDYIQAESNQAENDAAFTAEMFKILADVYPEQLFVTADTE